MHQLGPDSGNAHAPALAAPHAEARKTFARLSSKPHLAKLSDCTCAECAAMDLDENTIKRKWSHVHLDVLENFFAHIGGTGSPAKLPKDQLHVALPVLWEVLDELDRTSHPWANLKVGQVCSHASIAPATACHLDAPASCPDSQHPWLTPFTSCLDLLCVRRAQAWQSGVLLQLITCVVTTKPTVNRQTILNFVRLVVDGTVCPPCSPLNLSLIDHGASVRVGCRLVTEQWPKLPHCRSCQCVCPASRTARMVRHGFFRVSDQCDSHEGFPFPKCRFLAVDNTMPWPGFWQSCRARSSS